MPTIQLRGNLLIYPSNSPKWYVSQIALSDIELLQTEEGKGGATDVVLNPVVVVLSSLMKVLRDL